MTKKMKLVVGVAAFLVLLLAVGSLGFYTPPWWGKDEGVFGITTCGGSMTCNHLKWAIRVINTGMGHGIYSQSRSTNFNKGAVYGQATQSASGVYGKSFNGYGGQFESTSNDGVHVSDAGWYGVYIANAGYQGVHVSHATDWGGCFNGDAGGIMVRSGSGRFFEAVDTSPTTQVMFYVDNDGGVYANSYNTIGGDFAEMLPAASGLEPGDVLVIGADGKLTRSSNVYSTAVAGVYSTKPGFVGGAGDDEDLTGKVPLAVVGVVPVKASAENGSISPGDLLTTSSTAGHAMKAAEPRLGAVIGKALESLESGTGTIRMLVTLQ